MKWKWLVSGILLLVIVTLLFPYFRFLRDKAKISVIKTLFSFDSLKLIDNRVNILLLGIPGGDHEGPTLSDSITVISYDFLSNTFTSISIPRDVWSETLRDKINSAYAYGEDKVKGGGLKLAKAEVSAIVGIPIQYAAVVDFAKFRQIIDFLGGINITVEKSFTDRKFPIEGKENDLCGGDDPEYKCRYETISFTKGPIRMDGDTALKYIRSRHAANDEGSDFARGVRQQKVLRSVITEVTNLIKKGDFTKVEKFYDLVDVLIERDISNQQVAIILKNVFLKRNPKQESIALPDSFFVVPNYIDYEDKYVLIPKDGELKNIHQFLLCHLNSTRLDNPAPCEPRK